MIKNKDSLIIESQKIFVKPQKDVIEGIRKSSEFIKEKIDELKEINIENIEPLFWVETKPVTWMREDIASETMKQEDVLKNAPEVTGDFISLNRKEVKHEND